MTVCIQKELFDVEKIISKLKHGKSSIGAVVSFIGYVREYNDDAKQNKLNQMNLEHYPGMTEKALIRIELNARSRWSLEDVFIIHRVGKLLPSEPIVAVIVASKHRKMHLGPVSLLLIFLKQMLLFGKKKFLIMANCG